MEISLSRRNHKQFWPYVDICPAAYEPTSHADKKFSQRQKPIDKNKLLKKLFCIPATASHKKAQNSVLNIRFAQTHLLRLENLAKIVILSCLNLVCTIRKTLLADMNSPY